MSRHKHTPSTASIGLGDLSFQGALVAPPVLGACAAVLAVYSALGVRGNLGWSVPWIFPSFEVGPGDVGFLGIIWLLLLTWFSRRVGLQKPTDKEQSAKQYEPTLSQLLVSPTYATFGHLLWGAAAGVATRKISPTALPTSSYVVPLVAIVLSAIYHIFIAFLTAVYLAVPIGFLLLLLGGVGPIACSYPNATCAWPVQSWGGFFKSLFWMGGSAALWMFIFDVFYGMKCIQAMRKTILRVELSPVRFRDENLGSAPMLRILHLSDLHCVGAPSDSRCEAPGKSPFGNADIERRLATLDTELERCDVLLLTGDLTDTGDALQWNAMRSMASKWPTHIRRKVFVVPGNHDINFITHGWRSSLYRDTEQLNGRQLRQAHFAAFARLFVQPGDTLSSPAFGDALHESAEAWFDKWRSAMVRYRRSMRKGVAGVATGNALEWQVPIWTRKICVRGAKYALIGMDTSNWGYTVISNALGTTAEARQFLLAQCATKVAAEGYLPVIVGHHAMLPIYERGPRSLTDFWEPLFTAGAAQPNGDVWFEHLLQQIPAPGFVYLHGHRHVARHIGTEPRQGQRAFLLAAPSLLFGDEWDGQRYKVATLHSIALQQDGSHTTSLNVKSIQLHCK